MVDGDDHGADIPCQRCRSMVIGVDASGVEPAAVNLQNAGVRTAAGRSMDADGDINAGVVAGDDAVLDPRPWKWPDVSVHHGERPAATPP
ncbi:hypothetical protein [Streptomyces sp. NPDC046978]|uniref:hypothetical protein n=1 Tax=unclassified Streptomyces TaxID=2593676 RepID=UPI0033FD8951